MPDVAELFANAARTPADGLDLNRVQRRAVALRRQQQAVRGTVLVAAGLVVLVVTQVGRSAPDALEQIPADKPTPSSSVRSEPAAPISRGLAAPGSGIKPAGSLAPVRPNTTAAGTPAAQDKPAPAPARSQAAAPAAGYPPAASCKVDTMGLLPNEERTCRFTATREGGWRFEQRNGAGYVNRAKAFVDVTRNGRTTRYGGDASGRLSGNVQCGTDVVQPGDLVTVTVGQTEVGYLDLEIGAGAGYRCSS
ncbi:MAG TPA: hypothetical protein VNA30_08625 [Mycobacteriales bacterium]|nr:hypothetical protein [Mycobacteriales bacterium]